jgi:hypothetical protein
MDTGFPPNELVSLSFANATLTKFIIFYLTFPGHGFPLLALHCILQIQPLQYASTQNLNAVVNQGMYFTTTVDSPTNQMSLTTSCITSMEE